jgi:hypothetical protein
MNRNGIRRTPVTHRELGHGTVPPNTLAAKFGMEENCNLASYNARLLLDCNWWACTTCVPQQVEQKMLCNKDLNESRDPGMGYDILRWSSPVIFEKPSLWRRQQEIRSAKAGIDTSCLEIGTTAFR